MCRKSNHLYRYSTMLTIRENLYLYCSLRSEKSYKQVRVLTYRSWKLSIHKLRFTDEGLHELDFFWFWHKHEKMRRERGRDLGLMAAGPSARVSQDVKAGRRERRGDSKPDGGVYGQQGPDDRWPPRNWWVGAAGPGGVWGSPSPLSLPAGGLRSRTPPAT